LEVVKDKDDNERLIKPDPRFKFLRNTIKRIPFLSNVDDESLFDIIFALSVTSIEKDENIIVPEDKSAALMIIAEGTVDVVTSFESNEFTIDKLGHGSVLNHRNFFKKDIINVTYRCSKDCRIYSLDIEDMNDIIDKNSKKSCIKRIDRY
jgi:CRP-like cAMP-binding protein